MKILVIATLLVYTFSIAGCGASMKKFDWLATESAPKGFPMKIISGNFYDAKGGSLYIPNGRVVHDGWGNGVSTHIAGKDKKLVPNRFDILCFSYAENVFYGGEFELPFETLYQLFEEGYYSPNAGEHITFRRMVAGVAPGGHVSVWVSGIDKQIEVFSGKMDAIDFPWEKFLDNPSITREDYIDFVLKESLDENELNTIKNNKVPIGVWPEYSKKYPWKPLVTGRQSKDLIKNIRFYNGEKNYFSVEHNNDWENEVFPVPSSMTVNWITEKGREIRAEITFSEHEIFESFNEMTRQTENPFVLSIHIDQQDNQVLYTTTLSSGDINVPISNTQITNR
ncbi:hypothetical protein TDB9533_03481 [Thalassocella blandensis]|nr:hypothetical protein TDB9533_03481 [Thalassocella blandensis]